MKKILILCLIAIFVFTLTGCIHKKKNTSSNPVPTTQVSVKVNLPSNCPLPVEQLKLSTYYGETPLTAEGNGTITINNNNNGHTLFLDNTQGNSIALIYVPGSGPVSHSLRTSQVGGSGVGVREIAYGLIAINPYVLYFSAAERDQLIARCATHPDFDDLVSKIETALVTDPTNLYNPSVFPDIPKTALNIVRSAFTSVESMTLQSQQVGIKNDPHIKDAPGGNVQWANPKMIGYEVIITKYENNVPGRKTAELLPGKDYLFTFDWWPPRIVLTDPATSDYSLGDGQFKVEFTKSSPWAVFYNTCKGITGLVNLVAGFEDPTDDVIKIATKEMINQGSNISKLLSFFEEQEDFYKTKAPTLNDYAELMVALKDVFIETPDLLDLIVQKIWKDSAENAITKIMENLIPFLKSYDLGTTAVNETCPFFHDLFTAPNKIYNVTQTNGVLDDGWPEAPPAIPVSPAGPANLMVQCDSTNMIRLLWTDMANNEDSYIVERGTTADVYTEIARLPAKTGVGSQVVYENTGLAAGTTYYYRISAYNNTSGNSAYAKIYWTTYRDLPSAPRDLTAIATETGRIELRWDDRSGIESGFRVERKLGSDGLYAQIADLDYPNAESLVNTTNVTGDTTYYYRVYAYNADGVSGMSNTAATTTLTGPTDLNARADSSIQVTLTWSDRSTVEKGYKIERKLSGGSWTQIATINATSDYVYEGNFLKFTDSGVAAGQTCSYRVRAYKQNDQNAGLDNHSSFSNEVSVTTPKGGVIVIID